MQIPKQWCEETRFVVNASAPESQGPAHAARTGSDEKGVTDWARKVIETGPEAFSATIAANEGPFCFGAGCPCGGGRKSAAAPLSVVEGHAADRIALDHGEVHVAGLYRCRQVAIGSRRLAAGEQAAAYPCSSGGSLVR
jgi:hypothetical protein